MSEEPPKAHQAPLCLRCPSREKALWTENSLKGGGDVKYNAFKKCKGWNKKEQPNRWRGFVEDPNAPPFDTLSDDDCENALSDAFNVDKSARDSVSAEDFAGDGDRIEDAVTAAKTSANAQFNGMPLSKQLLEHAYQKIYKSKGKAPADTKKGGEDVPESVLSKAGAERPKSGFKDDKTGPKLHTNHFELNLEAGKKLFKYQVQGIHDLGLTGPKKRVLIQRLIDASDLLKGKQDTFAYNKEGILIAWKPLSSHRQKGDLVEMQEVPNYSRDAKEGEGPSLMQLSVEFIREISLDEFERYAGGENKTYEETGIAQALDIVISRGVADSKQDVFRIGDNKFFPVSSETKDLEHWGMVARRGFSSNVKAGNGKVLLNVNTACSAFYQPLLVSEYMDRFKAEGTPIPSNNDAKQHLIGLRVTVEYDKGKQSGSTGSPGKRVKTITGFSTQTARHQKFKDDAGNEIKVWDYFKTTYPEAAATSNADQYCVNTGSTDPEGKAFWFLPDQLKVVDGQIYRRTLDKIHPDMTATMIEFACRDPKTNRDAIVDVGLPILGLKSGQKHTAVAKDAGIGVKPSMMQIPFKKLGRPTIEYGDDKIYLPGTKDFPAAWKTTGRTFIKTQKKINGGVALIHDGEYPPERANDCIETLKAMIGENGVQVNQDEIKWSGKVNNTEDITTFLEEDEAKKADFVVLVSQTSPNRSLYADFRSVMDQYCGKNSIVFNTKKFYDHRGKPSKLVPYMASNAMKINIRLGNENHSIKGGFNYLNNGPKSNTLVLGADLIHPKQTSDDGTPTIAALVGSTDERYNTFLGSVRPQEKGSEYINKQNMTDMAAERIKAWSDRNNNQLPARILYYRDGTGLTQFGDVRQHEINAIHDAWNQFPGAAKMPRKLQMTTVIVVKRHSTRFYPLDKDEENTTKKTKNCMPGTVVDRDITSPLYFDFYLQSHDVEKGSAKPTHYFVLENGMNCSEKSLQNVTNDFCYNFQHSSSGVSYASPAYYADKLCERVSLYLRKFYDGETKGTMTQPQRDLEIQQAWARGGQVDENERPTNPWHKNLNDKMFWM